MILRHCINRFASLSIVIVTMAIGPARPCLGIEPLEIGSRRELFVDRYLIGSMSGGSELRLQTPRPVGTVLRFDKPWEGIYCGYMTVLRTSGGLYHLYYRGKPTESKDGEDEYTCVAQSKDGIEWERPNLGLFEFQGSTKNNIILANQPPFSHNFCPFVDTRPGISDAQRYKALAGIGKTNLVAYVSPDGIHWNKWRDEPVVRDVDGVFDSQNVSFWSESEHCYVLYYRKTLNHIRNIVRTTSNDFANWSPPILMSYTEVAPTRAEQFYTNQTSPYFRAPHIYISTAARFMEGLSASFHEGTGLHTASNDWRQNDCSDTVLMSSRGGELYDRTFPEGFVRPGFGANNWTSRSNYAVLGLVQTGEAEMSMYLQRHYGFPAHELQRLTLRLDGFASLHSTYDGGEVITKPIEFNGKMLELNYATSAAGVVRVELQTDRGDPIDGFSLADCEPIIGDEIARVVAWKKCSDVSALSGKPVRLRFVMKDSDLYSLQFVR